MSAPEPLVPAECSMAGNDWFPLHFDRLRKSKWWRRASDLARARNVMLWGEAYKQVPAGSMPDDDDDLAEAAGFGMDVDGFLASKAEIMAPWVMCSDGRWYHPTVCEVVLEAWEKASERKKNAAAKKAAQRAKVRGQGQPGSRVPAESAGVPAETQNVPRDTAKNVGDIDTHNRQDSTDSTEPPLPPEGGEQGSGRRRPKTSIAPDFPGPKLIDEQQAKAREAGADVDAAYQAERFRNWAIGKDAKYADWPATWRNWMLKAIQEAPRRFAGAKARTAASDDPWPARIANYRRNAFWNRLDWGPPPGKPGCTLSPELQMAHGYTPSQQINPQEGTHASH